VNGAAVFFIGVALFWKKSLEGYIFANIVISRKYWYHVGKLRFSTDSTSLPQSIQKFYTVYEYLHIKMGWYLDCIGIVCFHWMIELLEYCMVAESMGKRLTGNIGF
jgi:hypothetical protein